jgi:hypothetical protein
MSKILLEFWPSLQGPSRILAWGREVKQNHTLGRNYVLSGKNPMAYNSSSTTTVTKAFKLFESS